MKIESLPLNVLEVVQNNNGLKMYLNSLERGRPATPRSWLYEGKSDSEILSLWLNQLKKLDSDERGKLVYQYELSFLEKFGPQGAVKPVKELMDLVTEGFKMADSPMPELFKSKEWQAAKKLAIERLFIKNKLYHSLRPRALKHVVDDMRARDTLESNSGFPDFGRRKKPEILQSAYAAVDDGSYLDFPAILLFRNYNGKTRPVWMYPMSTNLVEGSFTQPLKEALTKTSMKFFNPWRGYDYVKLQMTDDYLLGRIQSASDFSHTDAHFTRWAMLEVFDVIKHAYQPKYWDDMKQSMLHVVDIPLIVDSAHWITGQHGVSSGSNWTNDVETYMDFIAECYFVVTGLVPFTGDAIGDDVRHVMTKYDPKFADKIAKLYQQMGFDVNSEKVTNEVTWVKYLQRLMINGWFSDYGVTIQGKHHDTFRGIYRTVKALNSSLNPEKFHSPKLWSVDMFCVRQFMILENCIDHPLFVDFVKFICNGNPHLRAFAVKTSAEIDKAQKASRLVPSLNPTYNQEKRDKPLSSFESIRIARNL
nr:MAG: RNA-dependent RNA polymerase [Porcine picobirnavirus]